MIVKLKVGESIQIAGKLTVLAFGQHREGATPPAMVVTAEIDDAVVAPQGEEQPAESVDAVVALQEIAE